MDLSACSRGCCSCTCSGAIVAFGPTFAFATIGAMGGAEPQHANFATRVSHTISSRLVYPIGITSCRSRARR